MTTVEEAHRMAAERRMAEYQNKIGGTVQGNLTVRDYFAAKAMQGIFSMPGVDFGTKAHVATVCYEMADAMIAERDK